MNKTTFLFSLLFVFCCNDAKITTHTETAWQEEMNTIFKDASKSPLKTKDLKSFKGLDFFPFDTAYVVKAQFTATPKAHPFKMNTSTNDQLDYVKYGFVTFFLNDKSYVLNVYQQVNLKNKTTPNDGLFLPFLDLTNGTDSYVGGRYINLNYPKNDFIDFDFNKAYNPYCTYNKNYSCPIVPLENDLNIRIEAGVKAFKN